VAELIAGEAEHEETLTGMPAVQLLEPTVLRREPALRRHVGLSFADRTCLATAKIEGATVLTADRAWATLDLGMVIRVIR